MPESSISNPCLVEHPDGLGQMTTEYQEIYGAVNTSTSPKVQYGYDFSSNHSRLSSITYPDGRFITRDYNSGIDDAISRPSAVGDGSGTSHVTLEGYLYLGVGTIVEQLRPQNSTKLTLIRQSGDGSALDDAGDQYAGLDRFGRIQDMNWVSFSGTSVTGTIDRFQMGYDPNSNVLSKNNLVNANFSELYSSGTNLAAAYDPLNRLTGFQRGTLAASGNNGSKLDSITTPNSNTNLASIGEASQSWNLDAQGNQASVTTDGSTRSSTVNQQNELTSVGGSAMASDANGNLTSDGTDSHGYIYDAWNRMTLANGPSGVGLLRIAYYDGLSRRIYMYRDFHWVDLHYSDNWQVIETEGDSSGTAEENVWSGGWGSYVDSMVERDQFMNSSNGTITPTRLYAEQDATYNITSLTNTSGTVVDRIVYSPYGQFVQLDSSFSGANTNAATIDWKYFNQGGRYDVATGLTNFRARDYDASLGRWMQQEPFGAFYFDGTNLQEAMRDNPVTLVDPYGEEPSAGRYPYVTPSAGPTIVVSLPLDSSLIPRDYIANARWGSTYRVGYGIIGTIRYKLELPNVPPPCLTQSDLDQLQRDLDRFNFAVAAHEDSVRDYLSTHPLSLTDPKTLPSAEWEKWEVYTLRQELLHLLTQAQCPSSGPTPTILALRRRLMHTYPFLSVGDQSILPDPRTISIQPPTRPATKPTTQP